MKKNLALALVHCLCFSAFGVETPDFEVEYGRVTLSYFQMQTESDIGNVVHAKPSELINTRATYLYLGGQDYTINQIIVGIDGIGAQACIYNGPSTGEGDANFTLKAPEKPGVYEVRFRYAQAYGCSDALNHWWSVGGAPDYRGTIGIIIVEDTSSVNERQLSELPSLTNSDIKDSSFWQMPPQGNWKVLDREYFSTATNHYLSKNILTSRETYGDVDVTFNVGYTKRKDADLRSWSHARGFSIDYFTTDDQTVSLQYFADVHQVSLYIRDSKKNVERILSYSIPENKMSEVRFSIQGGDILVSIDGFEPFWNQKTTLTSGKLRLVGHNNHVIFNVK